MFEKGFLQDVRHNLWEIAGMIFQTGSRHRVNSKTITGQDVFSAADAAGHLNKWREERGYE